MSIIIFGQDTKDFNKASDILEMRTMYSKTSANDDGSFTSTTYSQPIHFMRNGVWSPIDLSIQPNNDEHRDSYSMVNATNNFKTYFPSVITDGLFCQFSKNAYIKDMLLGKMYFESDGAIVSSESMHSSNPIFSINQAEYNNVYEGVDLVITINESRRKADYIIRSSEFINQIPASAEFLVFEETIELPEGWIATLRNKSVHIIDSDGLINASYDVPLLKDGSSQTNLIEHKEKNLLENGSSSVFFELVQEEASYKLSTKVRVDWMRSNERVFPIVIDPDLITGASAPAALYDQNHPSSYVQSIDLFASTAPAGSIIDGLNFFVFSAFAGDDAFLANGSNLYSYSTYAVSSGFTSPRLTGSSLGTSVTDFGTGSAGQYSFSTDAFNGEEVNQDWSVALVSSQFWWGIAASYGIEITFTAPNCSTASNPTIDMADDTGLTNVSFNNINNTSVGTSGLVSTGLSTDVCRGGSYPLSAKVNTAGDWSVRVKAWIDWNNNGTYEEDTEAYNLGTARNGTDIAVSDPQTVTVPSDAVIGSIPMRIVAAEASSYPSACDNTMYGEIEDYTIVVANPRITSSSELIDETTCGVSNIAVSVDANTGSGQWTYSNGTGLFFSSTDQSTTFQTNTFDTPITLIWTQLGGECINATAEITTKFNQPNTSSLDGISISTDSWVWGGLSNSDWSTSDNWYAYNGQNWIRQTSETPSSSDKVYVLPNSSGGLCVSSSNIVTLTNTSIKDLVVASNATIGLSGTTTLTGDFQNNGTVNASATSTLSMIGEDPQSISGTSLRLNNLELNKTASDLSISLPVDILGTLTMSSGNIVNGSNILTIGSSSSNIGSIAHSSGVITGKLRRYFAASSGSQFFPVGTAIDLRDVDVELLSSPGTDQYLTVAYNEGVPQLNGADFYTGLPLVTSDGQLIQNYDNAGIWEVSPTNDDYSTPINSAPYRIALHMNNLTGASDFSKVRIIKSPGSNTASANHTNWTSTTHESSVGTNSDFTVTSSATGFSFFGAGGDDDTNPLPVELISFSGLCEDGFVDLKWQTASEFNSAYFDVEYSRDGQEWNVIHSETAMGISNELTAYGFMHKQSISGDNYYRLNQFDIDGVMHSYYDLVVNADCQENTDVRFSSFPNPSADKFTLSLENAKEGLATCRIVDPKGNVLLENTLVVKGGYNLYSIEQFMAPGVYYIYIQLGDDHNKVIKHTIY
jgi:hypothetical protein